jgi:plastocyanin
LKIIDDGEDEIGVAVTRKTTLRRLAIHSGCVAITMLWGLALHSLAQSPTLDVSLRAEVIRQKDGPQPSVGSSSNVVVWLTPEERIPPPPAPSKPQQYTLVQKDKQFSPHLLVVPTGSTVDFPNLDPFFHNVFSQFNGKRFDLGLYEAHSHRAVKFDRDGVSYIFCNIHPEMGAVIVSLSTPYYGISARDGMVVLHGVPPGSYRLNLWAENVSADRLNALSRPVEVSPRNTNFGTFVLEGSGDVMGHHQNKFGESYNPVPTDPY